MKEAGLCIDHETDGESGLAIALSRDCDDAIVDLMLPKLDGLSIIENIGARRMALPVIILSARRSIDDRAKGLQIGGDDYLTKPFAFSKPLARVQSLLQDGCWHEMLCEEWRKSTKRPSMSPMKHCTDECWPTSEQCLQVLGP